MSRSHEGRRHGLKAHGLKPEAGKCPVSQRQKTIFARSFFFLRFFFLCRRDTGRFLASEFVPLRFGVFVLLAALASVVPVPAASASQPMTVKDYFLRLPNKYFEVTQAQRKDFISAGNPHSIVDIKHDYLYMGGDGVQPNLTVALFRYHEVVTVAVLDGGYDPNIPTLDFLRYRGGHWLNVTRHVLPLPFDNRLDYFLPRRGTTIRVCNSRGCTVYNLLWRQGRFRLGLPL